MTRLACATRVRRCARQARHGQPHALRALHAQHARLASWQQRQAGRGFAMAVKALLGGEREGQPPVTPWRLAVTARQLAAPPPGDDGGGGHQGQGREL